MMDEVFTTNDDDDKHATNSVSKWPLPEAVSQGGSDSEFTPGVPKVYRRRWLMLILFASYSMTNNYQWIHINIISNKIMLFYNASLPESKYMKEVAVDWLSMVYMLAYIPLIFPATWLLDRHGLRVTAICGALLNAIGAWIKCVAIDPSRFGVLMTGQTICAVAQIFILGLPARLAAVWFGPGEVSTATSIAVFGGQVGASIGFLVPPEIVKNNGSDLDAMGNELRIMMYAGGALTTVLFVLVLILFRERPPIPPSIAQLAAVEALAKEKYLDSLRRLITNVGFVTLLVTYGMLAGSYYEIGTLLNPIILNYFPDHPEDAGRIGLTLVLSGLAGALFGGIWLDRTKFYKSTTVFIYAMSFVGMIVFSFTLQLQQIWIVYLCSAFLGFFMTGYLPVGFEFAAELTFPESEGTSSGLLNTSAQVFGITLILSIRAMLNSLSNGILAGNLTVCGVLLLGIVGTALIKSDLRRQKAQQLLLQESSQTIEVTSETTTSEVDIEKVTPTCDV